MKHYRYGGSTAKRTMNCKGWRVLCDTLPEQGSSKDADRGTLLHNCCEKLELEDLEYQDLLDKGMEFNGFKLTAELLDTKVVPAMEALDDLIDKYGVIDVTPEQSLMVNELIGGTIDISAEAKDALVFADYKFGEGIMVYAEDNDQLLFYGWTRVMSGKFTKPLEEYKKVALAIIQPADRRDEALDVWEVTVDDLMSFGKKFLAAVEVAENSEVGENLCTGEWCQFCPASGFGDCPAKNAEADETMNALRSISSKVSKDGSFDLAPVEDIYDGKAMSLRTALEMAKKLEPWIKDVRAFACKLLVDGTEPDDLGYKLVMKKAQRKWVDIKQAENYLKRKLKAEHAMVAKVISPAQAEKASKKLNIKLRLKDMITAESSGTTLVPMSDKREAVISQKAISEKLKELAE